MTANTGALTPDAPVENKGLMSKIKEGVQWVTTKARNTVGSLVVGATALTSGLVAPTAVGVSTAALSENAEGANVIVQLNGLPTSTVSQPVKVSGLATPTTTTIQYNSQLLYSTPVAGQDTTIDSITLNLSAADIWSGWNLIFTFRLRAWTDSSLSSDNGKGIAGTNFQVRQELRVGPGGGPSEIIGFLDSGIRVNDPIQEYFSNAEAWRADSGIVSYSIPITPDQAGAWHLDSALFVDNSTGKGRLSDTKVSFVIPEPSTSLMTAGGLAAALLYRRRKEKQTIS